MILLASLVTWFVLVIVGLVALVKRTDTNGELVRKVVAPFGLWIVTLPLYGAWRIVRLGEHRTVEYGGLVDSKSLRRMK